MKIRLSGEITEDSIVDGPGLRAVVWTQGCRHHCPGCHNPSTHDLHGGFERRIEDLIDELKSMKLTKGLTLSGGDPFEQAESCAAIAKAVKSWGWNVWSYTGYTFESLLEGIEKERRLDWLQLLEQVDVLVDGPFLQSQKDLTLKFRGSRNQRFIDVQKSLAAKQVVLAKVGNELDDLFPVRKIGSSF